MFLVVVLWHGLRFLLVIRGRRHVTTTTPYNSIDTDANTAVAATDDATVAVLVVIINAGAVFVAPITALAVFVGTFDAVAVFISSIDAIAVFVGIMMLVRYLSVQSIPLWYSTVYSMLLRYWSAQSIRSMLWLLLLLVITLVR